MDIEEIQNRELAPTDEFEFACKECGGCCRKRREPIMVTACDIYYAMKAIGSSPDAALKKHFEYTIGKDSHLPVILLRERDDGSCSFLRKGKCLIHQDKPIVCRLFPLGRFYDGRDKKYHYFSNANSCEGSKQQTFTLQEWLELFDIPAHEEENLLWSKLSLASAVYMISIWGKDMALCLEFFNAFFSVCYAGLDMEVSCLANLQKAAEKLEKDFKGFTLDVDLSQVRPD